MNPYQQPPARCPRCGGTDITTFVAEWDARSTEKGDEDNTARLAEHQCQGLCEGASFWT